ncbi:methylenetetrahydrofolate--tRNA-(uracil(54)-C(5))-methyltransferase (FADH(2)-oxidizing) TrmFO [Collinsella sp. zg1085]|uniref:methylenetetrahydrofolate--tRNA-(uracil(54)- C(5))-methyltransferase (FADH(2)-oxidizing) TrmFO n=1 Tax=Collinsella sp. zg1085 TaxID=2844380 RepID=UPI001C0CB643|nr:methylenetetrahydrofolate--tRNA-(uracil(54)-C(5))-methyltransferase (FADH(2)-oxidizing) TrmFO [Collinsella sp. zg1085]QWT17039.1 methylenetetrahydrofolate--tRNA-(uracil(54)-C(5))-methyltransferase (FADH(2)-oxidizing) TrmFO [Collinsella sp. zg1085]
MSQHIVHIIGGGLAGCECALQLAARGCSVQLYEMRPALSSPAHHTDSLAELVCSNSLKSTRYDSAAGTLKRELKVLGSKLLAYAEQARVAAGGALAVDRREFSRLVDKAIAACENIHVIREEVQDFPQGIVILAAGPLCAPTLTQKLLDRIGSKALSFYDAAAPIVDASTLNYDVLFRQSRWDNEGRGDYLNAPLNKEEYERFIDALIHAKRVILKDFERRELFQACQPAEEVARTGLDALRFGAMKPVGLIDPRTGKRPWAAVQLRAEQREGSAYNLVGFQTNLSFGEQQRVFRMIPGLESAEFFRFGVMHRNTFVDSPHVLDKTFKIPGSPIRLAGQITGTEGYVEAIASGLVAALQTYAELNDMQAVSLPETTVLGSLIAYATNPETSNYQPMHGNFGLLPALKGIRPRSKRDRYQAYAERSDADLAQYLAKRPELMLH